MYPEYEDDLKLFELSENASLAALKTSYKELLKVWHPDKFPNDEKLKKRATSKLIEIKDAHDRLSTCFKFRDQKKRKSSKTSAKKKSVKPPPKDSRPIVGIVVVIVVSILGLIFSFVTLLGTPNPDTARLYQLIPSIKTQIYLGAVISMLLSPALIIGAILCYLEHPNGKQTIKVTCYIWLSVGLLSVIVRLPPFSDHGSAFLRWNLPCPSSVL